jgi:hypothetical protein
MQDLHAPLLADGQYRGYYSTALGLLYVRDHENSDEFLAKLKIANATYDAQRNLDINAYFLHELFHYFQAMSTTYFLSLNDLLWAKTWGVYGFLAAQKHFGRLGRLHRPVGSNVQADSYFGDDYTAIAFSTIRGVQRFRDFLNGDVVGITKAYYADAIVSSLICWQKDPVVKEFLLKHGLHFKFEQWMSKELPRFDPGVEPNFVMDSVSLFGKRIRTVDIVEHAAVVCSLWPALMNERTLSKGLTLIRRYYSPDYYFMIDRLCEKMPDLSAGDFYSNFLAACDFALNPPTPWEIVVRLDRRLEMAELLPCVRFLRALDFFSDTQFKTIPDDLEYVEQKQGWISRSAISELGSLLTIKRRSNWILQEHIKAQQIKKTRPYLFADPKIALWDASLLQMFGPPPAQMHDKTITFLDEKDKERTTKVLHWFVLNVAHNFAWDRSCTDWKDFCADPWFAKCCNDILSLYQNSWYGGQKMSILE